MLNSQYRAGGYEFGLIAVNMVQNNRCGQFLDRQSDGLGRCDNLKSRTGIDLQLAKSRFDPIVRLYRQCALRFVIGSICGGYDAFA